MDFTALPWFLIFTSLAKTIFLIFLVVLPMVSYTVYAERRVSALIQDRLGPNRTGFPLTLLGFKKDFSPFLGGLGQPVADAVKFLLKEDFVPAHVNRIYFWIAPTLAMLRTSMSACSSCSRSRASAFTASSSPAGRRTRNIPSSAASAARRR
jgi:NADH:ubiquinone oxidoreductase subunit H